MADKDILDDLDQDFEEDVEDILEESSFEDSNTEDDEFDDLDDADDPELDSKSDEEALIPEKKSSKIGNIVSAITGKIPGKLKSKKVLIILGALVAVLVVAAVVLMIIFSDEDSKQQPDAQVTGTIEGQVGTAPEKEIIFEDIVELEPFERVHLKTSSTMGMATLTIALELTDYRYRKQIYSLEDRIRQIVVSQLAEMTWLELRNPEGKIRLKYELLKRINALFPQPTVRNIYYTYFIMQ